MANTVLVQTMVQADNIDALNRTAKGTTDFQNGAPIALTFPATGEAFVATAATTGLEFKIGREEDMVIASDNVDTEYVPAYLLEVTANTGDVWLAYSPEVNKNIVGQIYGGLDPRNFTNKANKPFDVFKPVVGDIIQVTAPFFSATPTIGTDKVVKLTAGVFTPSAT